MAPKPQRRPRRASAVRRVEAAIGQTCKVVLELSPRDRRRLRDDLLRLDRCNCWWLTYACRTSLMDMIETAGTRVTPAMWERLRRGDG